MTKAISESPWLLFGGNGTITERVRHRWHFVGYYRDSSVKSWWRVEWVRSPDPCRLDRHGHTYQYTYVVSILSYYLHLQWKSVPH